ncbi:hypothetical protein Rleg2_4246 [Rhizobium leguminosarum bv. trifolii WSM2304]|uniref:AbiV family abortive infection protein n=1 Tax=Rhizobium leguminosarum bv. trifolii (strain WSM2304) TaxID=395492 RepID=A0ABF7QTC8_RHILW|nr:AbiV family abortive infection protein [Rhizobium leguminosarum]ACI57505.1 hypothetical protein Rleg2_4246 [Rhizobium leguminosarum bv. trifolii WSM2304]
MSAEALDAVFDNIKSLREGARSLYRQKRFNLSVHVAIAAREEMSKYLMLFCKEHLPLEVFNKRFSHIPKHRLAAAAYFISGQVSIVYLLEKIAEKTQGTEIGVHASALHTIAQTALVRGNPARTADAILHLLKKSDNEQHEEISRASVVKAEGHRTSSIYVDVSGSLDVVSRPSDITAKDAKGYLDHLTVGEAAIKFIRTPAMSLSKYVSLLPAKERRQIAKEIKIKMQDFMNTFPEARSRASSAKTTK